jgi:hypothetical protein
LSYQIRGGGHDDGSRPCRELEPEEGGGFMQARECYCIPDTVFMGGFMGGSVASQGGILSMTIHKSQEMGGAPFTPLPVPSSKSVDFAPVLLPPSMPSTSAGTTVILVEDNLIAPPLPIPPPPAPPVTSIKDKPSDMGLKDITDKTSWIKAKSVIDSRLCHAPFWPNPTSKALITMPENMVASVWWEELLYYYLKPPVCDLFVEESQFNGKGFEMINYIDKHFNPSGAVDSLRYIFNLIDIKQGQDKPVVTLRAQFSRVFASLKMGGMDIASSL